ncbi:hypothetical protein [Halegenticoccus tardaugens]|uniref:hypothetical protein n=1 Tax=Halegenticoccus tardaugens TaxID=2071624 RepID=UPI00100B5559|nr:hypothetical protein [Halegenticoccus tardaugens]
MSNPETESSDTVTATNVQRLESGYFDHMQSLREQVPVGEYIVEPITSKLALLAMLVATVVMLVLFPLTMFRSFSLVVIVVWLVVFVICSKVFYERVIVPKEEAETWRD